MRTLFLVRHGETAWNAEKRLQGNHDVALSPHGIHQAKALAPVLAATLGEASNPRVVTSPLSRASATCALLGLVPDIVDPAWAEADLGEWTGRTRQELLVGDDGQYAAWRAGTFTPPSSEPLASIRTRVSIALERLAGTDQVVVVTHGGPIRAVCQLLLGLEPARLVPVQPGSLTVIDTAGPQPRLRAFNLTALAAVRLTGQELQTEPTD